MWDLFPTELVTKMKPTINSVERFIHNWVITDIQWMDGWCAGGCWFIMADANGPKSHNSCLLVSPTHKFFKPCHPHTHTKCLLLTSLLSVFQNPTNYNLTKQHTHTYMEYTNARKWSKMITMPITEHRMRQPIKSRVST